MILESDLIKALVSFSGDDAVRLLTIHKSKGLEFDTVIIMAVEQEIFFGNMHESRCAFFVGISRAKRRLLLTHVSRREIPPNYFKRWDVSRTPHCEFLSYCRLV